MKKAILYTLLSVILIFILLICVVLVYFNYKTKDTMLDLEKLEQNKTTLILADDGTHLNGDNYIVIDDIPKMLIDSFLSIEDKRFYSHKGIDVHRMFGALWYNIRHGRHAQGASTITQQLIKNTHLTNKKTFDRKLKEIKLALLLERELSKDEILERYLNSLYFGNGIYGVKNAARDIFGKDIQDLTVSECATMAGIIKAPTHYSPLSDIERSKSRRDVVLGALYNDGKIDYMTYKDALNSEITINNRLFHSNIRDFYVKQALNEASNILKISISELMSGDFNIGTFYDDRTQNILANSVINTDEQNGCNALSIMMNNANSGISACFGNIKDNIFELYRQAGSTMKPLAVYLPALEDGIIHPCSIYDDSPKTIGDYSPHNYGDKYRGKISIRQAIMHSSNVIPVEILDRIGIDRSKNFLATIGIDLVDSGLSIALGGLNKGITPIDLLGGYGSIANSGVYSRPTFIKYISDDNGKIIYRYNPIKSKVFENSTAYLMTEMLEATAQYGTARKLSTLPFSIASKTGTVADAKDKSINTDAYNMSYTVDNTLLVWLGGSLDKSIQGGGLPTIIARNIYDKMYVNGYPGEFIMPDSVTKLSFDKSAYDLDGEIILSNGENVYSDIFDNRYLPTKSIVLENKITHSYIDKMLTINNVKGADIQIYLSDIYGNKSLIKEFFNVASSIAIPIDKHIFEHCTIEICFSGELIKTIII